MPSYTRKCPRPRRKRRRRRHRNHIEKYPALPHRASYGKDIKGTFVKLLHRDLVHHGYQYKCGLNIDDKPFTSFKCCPGGGGEGLHFCRSYDRHLWRHLGYTLIADVRIPRNAMVVEYKDELKANKIIISNIREIREIPDEWLIVKSVAYMLLWCIVSLVLLLG